MNSKTIYVLFGILGSVLILMLLAQLSGNRSGDGKAHVLPTLHSGSQPVKTEDIVTVVIDRRRDREGKPAEEKLVFQKTDQGWRLEQPSLKVQNYLVDQVIDQVRNAQKDETADVTLGAKQYALDEPSTVVTLKSKEDGREWRLNLGKESIGGDKAVVYVNSSDEREPSAVRRSQLDAIYKPLKDFLPLDLLNVSTFNTSFVDVKAIGDGELTLEKAAEGEKAGSTDGKWRFVKPPYGDVAEEGSAPPPTGETKPIDGVKNLVEAVGNMRLESKDDYLTLEASEADLDRYGVEKDRPATLRIEVKRTADSLVGSAAKKDPVTEVLLIGKPVEARDEKDKKEKDKKEPKYYARLESERSVVQVDGKHVKSLLAVAGNPAALRNRDLVQLDEAKTDAVDVKNAEGLIKLRRTGTPEVWKLVRDGKLSDAGHTAVQDLLKALNAKRQIKEFPDPKKADADYGFDKPAAVVTAWVEGVQKDEKDEKDDKDKKEEKKEEKDKAAEKKDDKDKKEEKKQAAEPKLKEGKPAVTLTFGKKERDIVYVKRETASGEPLVVEVPDTLLTKVAAGTLAYLDRTLPSFSESGEVLKLALERDGEVYEVEKDPMVNWKFTKPKDLAGKLANAGTVDRIVRELRGLHTDKLVAEQPKDLEPYGLKQPALKATVTVKKDDKTEDWTYLFGKEGDGGVYAKQDRRDVAFTVSPFVLTTLRQELQDPTVFKFDGNKATSLKAMGWKKLGFGTLTVQLEKAGAKGWVAKLPPDFEPDQEQVSAFILGLSNLSAERFVVRGKGAQPAHKLDEKERALYLELTVEGEKAPLTLTIGDYDAKEKAYYAQSSALPGDVFLLPEARFKTVLEQGPKYFSKGGGAK